MTSSTHKHLRLFILLLLTVFITETVYASGMMTVVNIASNHAEKHIEQCHENHLSHSHQQSQSNCHDCSHCFACVSMLVQGQFATIGLQTTMIAIPSFVEIYHSPNSAQPQKPPIA